MLSKNTIKYIRALQQKKYRQKYNNFVVEGEKMAAEMLRSQLTTPEAIYAVPEWIDQQGPALASHSDKITAVTERELSQISALKTANKVVLIARQMEHRPDAELVRRSLCIFLDDIRDPGNMGTILRIADWFGLPYIFCSPDCVDHYNSKVVQATMGAIFRVPVIRLSLNELTQQFPDLPYYAAMLDGTNVFTPQNPQGILIIGNESHGINEDQLPVGTHALTIPRPEGSVAESLNAAVATGILVAALLNN
ncbi:MAG: RNA methyltransferase [Bacteroidota bacterium]